MTLQQIKARAEAATPEPWVDGYGQCVSGPTTPSVSGPTVHEALITEEWTDDETSPPILHTIVSQGEETIAIIPTIDPAREANSTFIAHARQDVPRLCEALEVAKKEFQELIDGPNENAHEIHLTGDYQTGLFCGLEDRNITDRYDACMYGFDKAVERVLEWAAGMSEGATESINQILEGAE